MRKVARGAVAYQTDIVNIGGLGAAHALVDQAARHRRGPGGGEGVRGEAGLWRFRRSSLAAWEPFLTCWSRAEIQKIGDKSGCLTWGLLPAMEKPMSDPGEET